MTRPRSHSDPSSPPTSPLASSSSRPPPFPLALPPHMNSIERAPSQTTLSSLDDDFSSIAIGQPLFRSRANERYATRHSNTPSVTSVSDDEDAVLEIDEDVKSWVDKGKGKAVDGVDKGEGLAATLPHEVLVHILKLVHDPKDIFSALQVSRSWCLSGFSLLWQKPALTTPRQLGSLCRTLRSLSPSLPYAASIRRLNLSGLATSLNDYLIDGLEMCSRVDRITINNAQGVSTQALKRILGGMKEITAVDLSGTSCVENTVVHTIGEAMDKLQGLNLTGCKGVGDEGLKIVAEKKKFRRLKVGACHRITDASIVPITRACPLIIEYDLSSVPQVTNASLYSIFLHSSHVRELKLVNNTDINDTGIPNLADLLDDDDTDAEGLPWYAKLDNQRILPTAATFDHLRVVDLMGCSGINDLAVDNLVSNAPKLRHLSLAKCPLITDAALESIARLGKSLHHLHMGHALLITDVGVTKIARSCTRLRYIDIACCPLLTDLSVLEIAENLQKVKRIGLVKVAKITDEAIYSLVERHATLERIHLSYCEKISVKAIAFLLNRLLRLTHLSLTGVPSFKLKELQQFCRPTPSEFSESQRESFCVYSGHGITSLRNYLNSRFPSNGAQTSDEGSRRGSGSSQSSITLPARYSPPHTAASQSNQIITSYRGAFITGQQFSRRTDTSRRRESRSARAGDEDSNGTSIAAPVFRFASRPASPSSAPGLPSTALTASGPNFLSSAGGMVYGARAGYPPSESNARRASATRADSPGSTESTGSHVPVREYRRTGEEAQGQEMYRGSRLREEGLSEETFRSAGGSSRVRNDEDGYTQGRGGGEASNGAFRWVTNTFGWERK